jgi:hypothetical protein
MAVAVPAIPAILSFIGTVATTVISLTNQPKLPKELTSPASIADDIDQELLDAQRRKGRQTLAGDEQSLIGGPVGSKIALGLDSQTLVGN